MAAVDILMPVKNGIAYLAEAIDSVRAQTWEDWRLLVLDHGSDDGSAELATRYADEDRRIELRHFPGAAGLSGLLNEGLRLCDCRYVMRHDADDVCLPRRIELTLDAFRAAPGMMAIGGQAIVIDGTGAELGTLSLPTGTTRLSAGSLFRNPFCHPTITMDWQGVDRLGARYGIDFSKAVPAIHSIRADSLVEDYLLFGQLAMLGLCANIDRPLIRYRWHANNLSKARYGEQLRLSLAVSRFLARLASEVHGIPYLDPAPFCNHGGCLFDMDELDFDQQFAILAAQLRRAHGESEELLRELAYRKVLANRRLGAMTARYINFKRHHAPESGEWLAVRSWLLRRLPGRTRLRAA
jgi:glycosyltransferase involved in cell wall biosynthesis